MLLAVLCLPITDVAKGFRAGPPFALGLQDGLSVLLNHRLRFGVMDILLAQPFKCCFLSAPQRLEQISHHCQSAAQCSQTSKLLLQLHFKTL